MWVGYQIATILLKNKLNEYIKDSLAKSIHFLVLSLTQGSRNIACLSLYITSLSFRYLDRRNLLPRSIVLCTVHSNYTRYINLLLRVASISNGATGKLVHRQGYCVEGKGLTVCTDSTLMPCLESITEPLRFLVVLT